MDSMLMKLITILTLVSIVMLLLLIYVYYKNIKKIKSSFTIGLLIFAVLFLIQNLVSIYYYLTMMDYYVPAVEKHVFIFTLLQTIGFAILLKITWE